MRGTWLSCFQTNTCRSEFSLLLPRYYSGGLCSCSVSPLELEKLIKKPRKTLWHICTAISSGKFVFPKRYRAWWWWSTGVTAIFELPSSYLVLRNKFTYYGGVGERLLLCNSSESDNTPQKKRKQHRVLLRPKVLLRPQPLRVPHKRPTQQYIYGEWAEEYMKRPLPSLNRIQIPG